MYSSPHKSAPIDQIVEGFSKEAVLRTILSGKIDNRIKALDEVLQQIKAHEHSIHSVDKANRMVEDAEAKLRAATSVREEAARQINNAQNESGAIVAQAHVTAKGIVAKEVDAKTAASDEAKRIIAEANKNAGTIRRQCDAEADGMTTKIHRQQELLVDLNSEINKAKATLGAVRRALGDTDRITQL